MKLKIILLILSVKDLDTVSKELQYMSFDEPNVLIVHYEEEGAPIKLHR